ncbi:MAG: polyribonucleotide nucleotidyltransferase [Candidatus Aminicenantes bacterium]|nr:polyribonucleotide nucleotidyltransferase [Candidatus Aminicenantes bacterium]
MQKTIEIEIGDSILKIETHKWAKQSNGSAVITYKDNIILVTANMKDEPKEDQDFFPLIVDFRFNTYAAGKIPGGFFKREGRPSEREILLSRLIDRPIRPLFPENFFNDTQVIGLLISADFSVDYDSMGIIGASAALLSSTIPFNTPLGAVKIGWKDGDFKINPGHNDLKDQNMVLQAAGTETDIVMLEAGGNEFSEEVFLEGLKLAKEIITRICQAQKSIINPEKIKFEPDTQLEEIYNQLKSRYESELGKVIFSPSREERQEKMKTMADEIKSEAGEEMIAISNRAFHKLEYDIFRRELLAQKRRTDNRAFDEIRNIDIELSALPRVHGSAVFTRGETQALATVTLGSQDDAQRLDDLTAENATKKFMLHYNFFPFSVGEVSFLRGAGRREIGHGNLAEKSLGVMIPDEEKFPYTIRIVSDILESNGSSSMATVCSGSLALMEAGVPIRTHVAGIAMGLVKEGDDYAVLTDIAGFEDHFGDMDFKIAGTDRGINAIQMDIKINGLSDTIINETLDKARKARLFILDKMNNAISTPVEKLSKYAPVILTMTIPTDKIRDLIGPGGKTIKDLVATYSAKINTDDNGKVTIAAPNKEVGDEVVKRINQLTESVEVGKIYQGKITRIEDYGIFVEILNGVIGLVHISEISNKRVEKIEDENFSIGQTIDVKVILVDRDNRVKLSKKAVGSESNSRKRW